MNCAACQHENPAGSGFCEECGARLERRCPSCGSVCTPTAKFCRGCGASLAAPAAPPSADAVARKVVTIVFADLIGSTSLHERLDPESVSRVMDRYHRAVRVPVEAHGGTVVQLLGDGVMCAFGVPRVAEDDAIRAVRAAMDIHRAFREFASEERATVGDVGLRVAVNTGEVVVSDDYTAGIGDPLNVAARLQQEAHDGDVLISESTRRLVGELVTLEPFGVLALKGRAETVAAYRVVSLERAPGASTTPFVGREEELRRVTAVYDATVASRRARLTVVLGSPGLGKSRLMDEVTRRLGDGATVLTAHCDAAGGATFAPIARTLRGYLRIDDGASGEALRAAVEAAMPGDEAERSRLAGGIAALLAGAPGSPEETFFVVRRFLAALATRQPVVLALDDLHWAEPLLLDLVEHLIQWSTDVPLLVLAAARPELREARSSLTVPGGLVTDVVTLVGLDAGAATRLAANVIGAGELPAAVAGRVLATSEGNPLFVGELVRMLVADGALKREGDRWTTGVEIARLEMPPTIQALLAARIERLRPEERTVLERAAIVGRQFSRSAVTHLLPRETTDLDARLEALRRSELIEPDTGWYLGEPALRFHHVLIRDAAYRRLLKNTRADLHARFADWLEGRVGDAVEHDETIGWHLEQAHQHLRELGPVDVQGQTLGERAARYLAAAGRRALARDDLPLAAGLLGRALDRLESTDPARADLILDWCEALLAAGDVGPAAPAIDELGRFAGESARLRAWHTCFAGQLAALTDPQALRATADAVAAAAEALAAASDAAGEAKAHSVHALALARLGRVGACEAALDRALAAARRADDRRRSNAVLASAPLAALWGPSPVTRASGRCLDVVRVLRITQGAPAVEAVALRCQGVLEALRGRTEAARRMLASSRRMVEELGITQRLLEADVFTGLVDLLEGDAAAAERTLRAAYDGLRAHGLGIDAAQAAALLGRALLALGRAEEAEAVSHESEALAGDDLKAAIDWRGVRAEALARRGEHAAAVAFARAAADIAAATDALLAHADARLALAVALRAAGRGAEAAAEEQRAIELWDAKGATLLAERSRRGIGRVMHEDRARDVRVQPARPARRRLVSNAAAAFTVRLDAAIAARDTDAIATLLADGMEVVNHPTGTIVDREGALTTWRLLLRGHDPTCRHEPLATLGDSLVLCRMSISGSGFGGARFDVGAYERHEIVLIEVDSNGRQRWGEHFTDDRLGDAVVRLYERYAELLPNGPARTRAAATARAVAAVLGPFSLDGIGAIFAPDFEFVDHRPVGLPSSHGRDVYLRSLRSMFDLADDMANRADDVLCLRPDSFVLRVTNLGRERTGGGGFERPILLLSVFDADGLATRWEFFDLTRDAEALARFDELTAEPVAAPSRVAETRVRRVRANAASEHTARTDIALAARDGEALTGLVADPCDVTDHVTGTTYDREGVLHTWRSFLTADHLTSQQEPLATLGESLVLVRQLLSARGVARGRFDVGPYESEHVHVYEVDTQGRRRWTERFPCGRLGDAIVRLYERYAELLPDGPARVRAAATARTVAGALGPYDLDRYRAGFAPAVEYVDRRTLGLGTAHGSEAVIHLLGTMLEVAEGVHNRIEDVLALRADALLVRWTNLGIDRTGGGAYERPFLWLGVFGADGLLTRVELFDADRDAEALARFDELTVAPTHAGASRRRAVRPNAATANAAAIDAVIAARDPQAPAQLVRLLSDRYEFVDHINGAAYDLHGTLAIYGALMRVPDLASGHEPLATLGESLALFRYSVSASGVRRGSFDVGPYEDERIFVVETDSTGRRSRGEAFHGHRLGDAIARLYAWHADLLPDGPARARAAATARSVATLVGPVDLDRYNTAIARDLALVDDKTLGWGSVRGAEAFLGVVRSLLDVSSDTALRIDDVLGIRPDAVLVRYTNFGTDRASGGAYERQYLAIWTFDADGLLGRWEQFDPDRDDEALACFEELTGTTAPSRVVERRSRRVRANAATASDARIAAAMAARDGDALAAVFAEDAEGVEHPTGAVYDREGVLRSFRSLLTAREPAYWQEPLASLGDALALSRVGWSASGLVGRNFDVGAYETDGIYVVEVDAHGRRRRTERFLVERLGDAVARLYERYAELLPEGPARERAAATARAVAAMVGPIEVARWAPALAPTLEFADHRHISLESGRGADAYLRALQALLDVTEVSATRIDDVLALRPDAVLVHQNHFGTARVGGGAFERPNLFLWVFGADGLMTRLEFFEVEDEDRALARFDELTGERPGAATPSRIVDRRTRRVHLNAATANTARFDAAVAARDAGALVTLFTDDSVVIDHPTGLSYDRQGALSSYRSLLRTQDPTYRHEPLATLGDSLALCRGSMSANGVVGAAFDVGPYQREVVALIEVDASGRRRRTEDFAANRLGDAVVRLYERYSDLLPDGPARARAAATARAVAAHLGSLDLDRMVSAVASDVDFYDHRPLIGFGLMRGAQGVRDSLATLFDAADGIANRVEDILDLRPDAALLRVTNFGTDRTTGGMFERPFLLMWVFGADGLMTHTELFDVGHENEALARFDELTATPPPAASFAPAATRTRRVPPNAATANAARFDAVIAARAADALPALFADVAEFMERPTAGVYDREGVLISLRSLLRAHEPAYRHEPLATLGDVLALCRVSMSATGLERGKFDVGAFETEHLDVVEVDAQGRRRWVERFASDRLGDAVARLYERYAELLPAGSARDRAAGTARSVAAYTGPFDPDRYTAAWAPDIEVVDSRILGTWSSRGAEAFLENYRSWLDLADDTAFDEDEVLGLESRALLWRRTFSGLDRAGGGAFERQFIQLCTFGADGRITRLEYFDADREDLALARFDEVTAVPPTTVRIENAATRVTDRLREAWEARDWERVAAGFDPAFRLSDRRTMMHLELDRERHLASLRTIFDLSSSRLPSHLLATRGERLGLFRQRFEGSHRDVGPSEVDFLALIETNERGDRRIGMVLFDPDDLDAAYDELDARYLAGEAAPFRHARVVGAFKRTFASRAWEAMSSSFPPDFVLVDHRPLGWGTLDGPTYLESLKVLAELAPDTRFRTDHLWTSARGLMFVNFLHGTRDGGPFEEQRVHVYEVDGQGLGRRQDFYALDQLDEARARFEELRSDPLRIPPNAATRVSDRHKEALAADDMKAFALLCAPTMVFDDRRRAVLLTGGRDMFIASSRLIKSARGRASTTLLATAGDRLTLEHLHWTGGVPGQEWDLENLSIHEVDAEGRTVAVVAFDPDDRRAASKELLERYARSDAGRWMPPMGVDFRRGVLDHDLDRIRDALPDDFVFHDHRRTGPGRLEGRDAYLAWLAALFAESSDAIIEPFYYVATGEHGFVAVGHTFGTLAEGGAFEFVWAQVGFNRDGRPVAAELFEVEDLDRARARFEELGASPARDPLAALARPNAANATMDRVQAAYEARDWAAMRALFAPDAKIEDRRRHVLLSGDLDVWIEDWQRTAGADVVYRRQLVKTGGERVALERVLATGTLPAGGPFEIEYLGLIEVDERGRIVFGAALDADDWRTAQRETLARVIADAPVAAASVRSVVELIEAFNDHDAARLRATFSDDVVYENHRRTGVGRIEGASDFVGNAAILWGLAPDIQFDAVHILAYDRHGVVGAGRMFGTLADGGGVFEICTITLFTVERGRITRDEVFEPEDVDAALARFAELRPNPLRIPPNAATRASDRHAQALEARDWDAQDAVCAPTLEFDDRRKSVLTTGGRDMFIASGRLIGGAETRIERTLLATAGDRLMLEHVRWIGADHRVPFEMDNLSITEVDAEGRIVAVVSFDPDDRRAAGKELFERYARSDAGRWIPSAQVELRRAILDHDIDRMRAAIPDDYVYYDHRRTGPGRLEGPEAYLAWLATLFEQSSDAIIEPLYFVAIDPPCSVAVGHTLGTSSDGGPFESLFVQVILERDGRTRAVELFELDDLDAALARCEALRAELVQGPPEATSPAPRERSA
ncbi:MAG TPA: nuclear transport factor 2 family protein [Candidatus Eisenbacteria bacterium]|nr:nuclear transport factor 2 family protein [Candidatus Eisenbacteria bacterium]